MINLIKRLFSPICEHNKGSLTTIVLYDINGAHYTHRCNKCKKAIKNPYRFL